MNLSRVVGSRRLGAQSFTVLRSTGSFVSGRWVENPVTSVPMHGIISVMSEKELVQFPEADLAKGAMIFCSKDPIYTTRIGDDQGISDKVIWRGEEYKIFNVAPWADYGYYRAVGERTKGA
jgi:hypothetical protein